MNIACADPEGGRGSGPHWRITNIYIGFVSNTGPGP